MKVARFISIIAASCVLTPAGAFAEEPPPDGAAPTRIVGVGAAVGNGANGASVAIEAQAVYNVLTGLTSVSCHAAANGAIHISIVCGDSMASLIGPTVSDFYINGNHSAYICFSADAYFPPDNRHAYADGCTNVGT